MCTAWIDGFNGVADHLAQNINLAVVAAADTPVLRSHARARGWKKLRLLSAGSSTFKYDMGSEDRDGKQDSTISVFSRANDGTLRHFYSAHPRMAGDIKERGIDLLNLEYAGSHTAGTRRLVCETRISETRAEVARLITS
jgi:predicted dithiol-disulfide oxidoreductase (DUF899 family)